MGGGGVLLLLVGSALLNVCLAQTSSPSICPAVVSCYTNSIVQSGCINNASNIVGYVPAAPAAGYSNISCANNPCLHGGTCVPGVNTYTCNCAPMFVGSQCQTFWCDYAQQQNLMSQAYNIPGWPGKLGYCDNSSGTTYLVIQRRQDGSVNFVRNWTQYEQGFGNVYGEFWFGNWYISQLTASTWWLIRFDLWDWAGVYGWSQYANFSIGVATNNYVLTTALGAFTGNATENMYGEQGMQFTTFDQDHDNCGTCNCAVQQSGAWWYNTCGWANLNGVYNSTVTNQGIYWANWHGWGYSLKKTEMKIRPTI